MMDDLASNYFEKADYHELISIFSDESEDITKRICAGKALSKFQNSIVFEILIKGLINPNQCIRCCSIYSLSTRKYESIIILIKYLDHSDIIVRIGVSIVLGNIGSEDAIRPLIKTLIENNLSERDFNYYYTEDCLLIPKYGFCVVIPKTEDFFDLIYDNIINAVIVNALKCIGKSSITPLTEAYQFLSPRDQYLVIETLGELGDSRALQILTQIFHESENNYLYEVAIALGKLGPPGFELLLNEYNNNPNLRNEALYGLYKAKYPKILGLLLQSIMDEDYSVRSIAVSGLSEIDNLDITPLIDNFLVAKPEVRRSIIEVLGKFADIRSFDLIKDAYLEANPEYLWEPAIALTNYGPRGIEILINTYYHGNSANKRATVHALAKNQHIGVIELLKDALTDPNGDVRTSAVIALGDRDDVNYELYPPSLLKDEDNCVRFYTAMFLGNIPDIRLIKPFANLLVDKDPDVRRKATEGLEWLDFESFRKKDFLNNNCEKKYSELQIGNIKIFPFDNSEKTIGEITSFLLNPNPKIRCAALKELNNKESHEVINLLFDSLHDQEKSVRITAIKSLENRDDFNNLEPLYELFNDPDACVRYYCKKFFENIRDTHLIKPLIRYQYHYDPFIRNAATEALEYYSYDPLLVNQILHELLKETQFIDKISGIEKKSKIGELCLLQSILEHVNDDDPNVRKTCFVALQNFKGDLVNLTLIDGIHDRERDVRIAAIRSFGPINDGHVVDSLLPSVHDSDPLIRIAVLYALSNSQYSFSLNPIIEALKDEDANVRIEAIHTVAKLGGDAYFTNVIECLQDADIHVRIHAIRELEEIGGEKAIESIIYCLHDPSSRVRITAIKALGQMKDSKAIKPLLYSLNDTSPRVRRVAQKILQKDFNIGE